MRPPPTGVGIGGKAGVHQRHGRLIRFILEVVIELPQLADQKHPLVDDRPAGEGGDIGSAVALLKDTADHVQLAVKRDAGRDILRFFDKALVDLGHAVARPLTQYLRMHRHLPPKQEFKALLLRDDLQHLLRLCAQEHILREEEHAHAVLPLLPEKVPAFLRDALKKRMGDLEHNPHAVAHLAGGVLPRAVLQMLYDFQRVIHHPVAPAPLNIDYCADPAGIMFKCTAVKALLYLFHPVSSVLYPFGFSKSGDSKSVSFRSAGNSRRSESNQSVIASFFCCSHPLYRTPNSRSP